MPIHFVFLSTEDVITHHSDVVNGYPRVTSNGVHFIPVQRTIFLFLSHPCRICIFSCLWFRNSYTHKSIKKTKRKQDQYLSVRRLKNKLHEYLKRGFYHGELEVSLKPSSMKGFQRERRREKKRNSFKMASITNLAGLQKSVLSHRRTVKTALSALIAETISVLAFPPDDNTTSNSYIYELYLLLFLSLWIFCLAVDR